jgi:hypothetical protein
MDTGNLQATTMPVFIVNADNKIEAYPSRARNSPPRDGVGFTNERELWAVTKAWPSKRLVEIWNKLPSVTPVRKFTDRKTAIRRIWLAIQKLSPADRAGPRDTKTERILTLLKQPSGVTLKQVMAATGWQAHSVRGFISARAKKMGVRVQSFKRNGERVYRIRRLREET